MPIATHSLYHIIPPKPQVCGGSIYCLIFCAFIEHLQLVSAKIRLRICELNRPILGLAACENWTGNFKTIHLLAHVTWTIWRDRPTVWRISGWCSTFIVIHATPDRWHYSYPLYIYIPIVCFTYFLSEWDGDLHATPPRCTETGATERETPALDQP